MTINRHYNCKNPFQGDYKKVLCVCSAGLLRSPTMAEVFSEDPYNYNTRAVGADAGHALIPIDSVLIDWADEIVFSEASVKNTVDKLNGSNEIYNKKKKVVLRLPDQFEFRHPVLIDEIKTQYDEQNSQSTFLSV